MKLAVNLSSIAEDLLQQKRIPLDLFKCPAWPEFVNRVRQRWPVYVHFPLAVGRGSGEMMNSETHARADWSQMEPLLEGTATRHVNVHLASKIADFPGIPHGSDSDFRNPIYVDQIAGNLIRDVTAVVKRFGPDRVIAENIYSGNGLNLPQCFLPEVITRVIAETGCGFLFDLSHARMAARDLNLPPRDYIEQLPLRHIREIHVTGIQMFDAKFTQRLRAVGVPPASYQPYVGRIVDHLPMVEEDWQFLEWTVERIRSGAWGKPWVITYEYGGVNSWWEAITDPDILESQIPRMRSLISI